MAQLIDGKKIAAEILDRLKVDVTTLREQGRVPTLVGVIIGDSQEAKLYAKSQARHAESAGIAYRLVELPATTSQADAERSIRQLNQDASVHGIMLHLPIPPACDGFALQQIIASEKDVEGIGANNLGMLAMGKQAWVPCTAAAAYECLKSTGISIAGAEAVVVGRSTIVGRPLALLLLNDHATVTTCHTKTRDLAAHTRRADIVFVAAGKAKLIGAEHVRPGAIVIDVGTNRVQQPGAPDGKLITVGDVRFDEVAPIAAAITPVPGGVGPVTVMKLLSNTVAACRRGRTAG